jgi:flagellar basal-body rod protein FlgB
MSGVRSIDLVAGLEQAMNGLAARQKVIASNIANATTPGYKARDAQMPDFSALLAAKRANAGSDGPISTPSIARTPAMQRLAGLNGRGLEDRRGGEMRADGNTVALETEMMRMAETQAQFAATASLYKKSMGLMRTALGRGNS